jgi:hypothetical protein
MGILYTILAVVAYDPMSKSLSVISGTESSGLYIFITVTFLLSLFQYVLSTTITGESMGRVADREKGTLLGMEHALFAAARVVAPYAGVSLWKSGGISMVALISSVVYTSVWVLWERCKYTLPPIPVEVKDVILPYAANERKEK